MAKDQGQSKARPRSADKSKFKIAHTQARKAKNVQKAKAFALLMAAREFRRTKRERERARDLAAFRVARAAKRRAEEKAKLPPWQAVLADIRSYAHAKPRAAA